MPRPDRIHIEGGVYHVFNRLGRGERVFGDLSPRRRGTLPKS